MNPSIRPLSVWQLLNRSLRLYRRHFRALFPLAVCTGLGGYVINRIFLFLVQGYLADFDPAAVAFRDILPLLTVTFGVVGVAFAVLFVEVGVLASVVSDCYLERFSSLSESLGRTPLVILLSTAVLASLVMGAAVLLLLLPALMAAVALVLAPVIVPVERLNPTNTLKKSWDLVRSRLPGGLLSQPVVRIAIVWVFIGILNLLGLTAVFSITRALPDSWKTYRTITSPGIQWEMPLPSLHPGPQVAMDLGGELIQAFLRPFGVCALVLLYYDIRLRREGLDIAWLLGRSSREEGRSPPNPDERTAT
jgi:hypothetical protein